MSLLAWRAARRSAVLQTRALGARGDFKQSYGFRGGAAVAQEPKERTLDDQHVNPHEKAERVRAWSSGEFSPAFDAEHGWRSGCHV